MSIFTNLHKARKLYSTGAKLLTSQIQFSCLTYRENWKIHYTIHVIRHVFMCMLKCYVLTMLLSFVVLYDNAISFDTATTHTPVRSNRLWNFLMGYSSQRKICQGFRDGFRIGISKPFTQNHDKRPRRVHNREELVNKLNVELENGRILGHTAAYL